MIGFLSNVEEGCLNIKSATRVLPSSVKGVLQLRGTRSRITHDNNPVQTELSIKIAV
jgi:hypothetical protein